MGLRIATNTQSLAAQRNLRSTNNEQRNSLEKLASGSRIVRAGDDAAGLAISEKLKGQIRSIRQDSRNANDGISLVQTAEGGMNEIGNILIRFRELSIAAASDTIGDTERGFIDKEVQQLKSEIDRIAQSTSYNSRPLLSGEGEALEVQVGQYNDPKNDRVSIDMQNSGMSSEILGLADFSVGLKESAQEGISQIDVAINKVTETRATFGAMQNRLQSTIRNLDIYDENLSAANSRIRDVDMASETAELTKQNILSNAGVSVLSQANNNNLLALKLLG